MAGWLSASDGWCDIDKWTWIETNGVGLDEDLAPKAIFEWEGGLLWSDKDKDNGSWW